MRVSRTDSDSHIVDGFRSIARCGEVATCCTDEFVVTLSKSDDWASVQDVSIIFSPRVTRLRVAVRHTCQHVTRIKCPIR